MLDTVLDYDKEAARYDATRGGDARADADAWKQHYDKLALIAREAG
jgi:hypothetical protein